MKPATTRRGRGPILVCHPGGPGFAGVELADLGGLDRTRELVLVDPRGTGATGPAASYRLDDYVGDLDELREGLALETIDLLGFSHGGLVAIAYAATHPAHVRKLVLASALAAFTAELEAEAARVKESKRGEPWYADAVDALDREDAGDYRDDDLPALWRAMAPMFFAHWDERFRPWVHSAGEGASAAPLREFNAMPFDLRPDLPRIDAETLVITGADDFICGPAAATVIADGIRGAELVILDDAGHMTYLEQPETFRTAVEDFLAR